MLESTFRVSAVSWSLSIPWCQLGILSIYLLFELKTVHTWGCMYFSIYPTAVDQLVVT